MVQMLEDGTCSRCGDWARDCSCEQELADELMAELEDAGFTVDEDEFGDIVVHRPVPGFGEYTVNIIQRSNTWMIRGNGLHGRVASKAELDKMDDVVVLVEEICRVIDAHDWPGSVV